MTGTRITRRTFATASTFAAIPVLAACSATTAGPSSKDQSLLAPSGKEITLTHVYNWGPAQFAPMEKSTAAFMEKNPKIKVASTYATPFVDKVLALFAGGTPPDVLSGDVYNFRWQLVEQGALGPLDAFIKADKFDTSDFDPDILKGSVYNGKQYGMPYFGSASVVGYNKTLLDSRGLKPPAADWKTADYLALAQALTRRSGDPNTTTWGIEGLPASFYMESFLFAEGASVLDDQLTKCTLDTPAAVGVLRWWADAMWKHRIAPLPEEKTAAGNLPGNIGMWVMWPHATPARREKNANFDWDIQVLPAGGKGHGSVNMDFPYMVPAQPAAPAETWAFIKHMTDKEALERNAREALLLPARKSATQAFYTPGKPPTNQRAFPDSFKGSRNSGIYRTPIAVDLNTIYNTVYSKAITAQDESVEQAVARVKRDMDEKLAASRAQRGQK